MKQTSNTAGATALAPIQLIKVTDIVPDPKNQRRPEGVDVLAASIKREGLLQPVILRSNPAPKAKVPYMLVAGERRWEAHKLLKLDTIEARVRPASLVDANLDAARKRHAENFHREDLSPIQKARALQELFDLKMPQAEIAAFVGAKDQSTVSNFCRLLRLPPKIQDMVHRGELSVAHAKAIVRFGRWPSVCEVIAAQALSRNEPSKRLETGVPFEWELERKKLIVRIDTDKPYSFDRRPQWSVPEALQKDPDFLKVHSTEWVCFAPSKWAPEQNRQMAEWEKQQKAAGKSEASKQSRLSPAEKKARQKKIADNKAARAKIADTLARAKASLKLTKGLTPELVHVLVDEVLQSNAYGNQLKAAAAELGITLPKSKNSSGYWRIFKFAHLQSLTPADSARLAVLAVIIRQSDDAARFASKVPDAAEHIAGKAKKGGK